MADKPIDMGLYYLEITAGKHQLDGVRKVYTKIEWPNLNYEALVMLEEMVVNGVMVQSVEMGK